MKIKCLAIALIAALIPAFAHAQGTPVKNLYGSGIPNANLASVVGTTYVDQSISPATVYPCTAVTLTPTASQCTWTSSGSGSGGPLAGVSNGGIWQKKGTIIYADPTSATDNGASAEA